MKKIILFLIAFLTSFTTYAQDCEMPLHVVIYQGAQQLDASSINLMTNKLRQIVVKNGIVGGSDASTFAITADVDVINKEIIAGSPTKYIYVLNVNLYIANTYDQTIYASTSVEVRCAGNSETKAFVEGIKRISPNNAEVQAFVKAGKDKILAYYDKNYKNIIKQAKAKAALYEYEEAIFLLMAVPVCSTGYDTCMKEVKNIFQQYIDRQCDENLANAQAAWMSGFSKENASVAAVFLSEIYPDAACYSDAQALVKEIKKHMGEEWKFEMKQWDGLVDVEKQRLTYAREIAIAFAQNQPDQVVGFLFK